MKIKYLTSIKCTITLKCNTSEQTALQPKYKQQYTNSKLYLYTSLSEDV